MDRSDSAIVDTTDLIKRLILKIVLALVDYPDAVEVETEENSRATVITVKVANKDIGKVIGKQGRTARSLRTILSAVGMKFKHQFALDIVDCQLESSKPSEELGDA